MSTPADLEQALADYLQVRRASGAGLARAEKLLRQYLSHLSEHGTDRITVADAAAWATLPAAADRRWWAYRLSVARGFAAWLHTFDESVQVPPAGLIRSGPRRSTPYLYSADEIVALLDAAGRLRHPLKSATYQTLLGLLAVTGHVLQGSVPVRQRDSLSLCSSEADVGMLSAATGVVQVGLAVSARPGWCVESGHEFAVGGAGGGEVFVAFVELLLKVDGCAVRDG